MDIRRAMINLLAEDINDSREFLGLVPEECDSSAGHLGGKRCGDLVLADDHYILNAIFAMRPGVIPVYVRGTRLEYYLNEELSEIDTSEDIIHIALIYTSEKGPEYRAYYDFDEDATVAYVLWTIKPYLSTLEAKIEDYVTCLPDYQEDDSDHP